MSSPVVDADGLGCVFHHQQVMLFGKGGHHIHVADAAVDMHRHDGLHIRAYKMVGLFKLNLEVARVDIDEYRGGSGHYHGVGRGYEGEVRHHDLVSRPYPQAFQGQINRQGAVWSQHAIFSADALQEAFHELFGFRPFGNPVHLKARGYGPVLLLTDPRHELGYFLAGHRILFLGVMVRKIICPLRDIFNSSRPCLITWVLDSP